MLNCQYPLVTRICSFKTVHFIINHTHKLDWQIVELFAHFLQLHWSHKVWYIFLTKYLLCFHVFSDKLCNLYGCRFCQSILSLLHWRKYWNHCYKLWSYRWWWKAHVSLVQGSLQSSNIWFHPSHSGCMEDNSSPLLIHTRIYTLWSQAQYMDQTTWYLDDPPQTMCPHSNSFCLANSF